MKRFISILILCMILASCKPAGDPDRLFGEPSKLIAEQDLDETKQPVYIMTVTDPKEIPYNHSYMLSGLPGGWFCDMGRTVLFKSHANNILYEYDKTTGTVDTFCKDAACRHKTESCITYGIYGNLELFNGVVYASKDTNIRGLGSSVVALNNGRFVQVAESV